MPLTDRERAFIIALSARQDALERSFGARVGGPLGLGAVLIDQEFGLFDNTESNLKVARASKRAGRAKRKKIKRTVSAYQREFGVQLKKLKKKHPRTDISRLMKKAHIATRKSRRSKK